MEVKINEQQRKFYERTGLWTDRTLLDCWNETVRCCGGREYVADNLGSRYTYGELDAKADILAGWMRAQGVRANDRISIQCSARSEFVLIVWACFKIGAVLVPMKMRTGAAEWIRLMEGVKSRIHFCLTTYRGEDMAGFVEDNERQLSYEIKNVYIDEGPAAGDGARLSEIMKGPAVKLERPDVSANDIAVILFTSGTTSGSKGVLLSHNNVISSEKIFNRMLKLTSEDSIFMPAPLSHATGFHHGIISPMLVGGRLVLLETYSCRRSMEIMEAEKCTYSMGATPFIYDYLKLMDEGVPKPSCLKYYICGGAPVPEELVVHAWNEYELLVCECYGSTESVPHVLVLPEQAMEMKGRWSGSVPVEIEVRVVDDAHQDVPPGTIGEEVSRGPNVFLGYLNDKVETDKSLDEDGWYYSGDLCYSDGKGNIKICGRKKDIIVRGGENLNINEIERNLRQCPGIADVSVVGIHDERLGERVCAFVVPENEAEPISQQEILGWLRAQKISKWLWPEKIEYIAQLPYTESGKIKRYILKREYERRMGGKKVE